MTLLVKVVKISFLKVPVHLNRVCVAGKTQAWVHTSGAETKVPPLLLELGQVSTTPVAMLHVSYHLNYLFVSSKFRLEHLTGVCKVTN